MSLVQVMDIAEGLLQLDPVRSYRVRGAEQVCRTVRARAYVVHQHDETWASDPKPLGPSDVELPLRFGREEVGKVCLYLDAEPTRLGEDDLRVARWATRLYGRGLAYVERLHREGVRRGGEPIDKMLTRTALTPRERELVLWLADGGSTKEIAAQMGLTKQTVNTYLKRIYAKVGVHSRVELLARFVATPGSNGSS